MTEKLKHITPDMSEEEALGVILDEIIARAEPDVAEALRLCAIPHWFNEEIIAWLRGEGREPLQRARKILAKLTELTFVAPYHDHGYAYHENVRNLLLHRWRREKAKRFQRLSGGVAAYYADKLRGEKSWLGRTVDRVRRALGRERAATNEQRNEWRREAMYHLLVADEEQGFDLFNSMFNRARQFRQLSTCDLLLGLAEEQKSDLSSDNQVRLRLYRGQVAYDSALWDEALRTFKALEREDLPQTLTGTLANELGLLYKAMGKWDKAIEYYQRSLALCEKVGNERGMATTFNNLGTAYRDRRKWDQAVEYYQRSLTIYRKVGDEHGTAITLSSLGMMYQHKGEWDKAIEYYQRSLAIYEKVGDEVNAVTTMRNIALLYEGMERYGDAVELLERIVRIDERVGHPDLASDRETLERIRERAG
jgi:tetratricopeptide (TPR) repeat protein